MPAVVWAAATRTFAWGWHAIESRGREYDERTMTNAFDEARTRLIEESTDRDWYDLWPRVTAGRAELLRALEGVTEETAARRPGDGEGEAAWSIAEVVRHALMYTRNVRTIIEETARGRPAVKDARGLLPDAGVATFVDLRRQVIAEVGKPRGLTGTASRAA